MKEAFAQTLRRKGFLGESAYGCVDGEKRVDLPAQSFKGRTGTLGRTFSGCLDLEEGKIRVDCAEDLGFWLEIDLRNVPALNLQPDAPGGKEAIERARKAARAD